MSLDQEIRFGPDVQWLDPPVEDGEDVPDFWASNLGANEERLQLAVASVQKFLPGVKAEGFSPDCKVTSSIIYLPSSDSKQCSCPQTQEFDRN